jgi:hypothetical protein
VHASAHAQAANLRSAVGAPSGVDGNGPKRFERRSSAGGASVRSGAATALKRRERDDRDDEIARLKSKVGEIDLARQRLSLLKGTIARRLGPGRHASRSANRFEALEPVRQGVHRCFGTIAPGVARGLKLRHDHGSNYMSDENPLWVRAPQPRCEPINAGLIRTQRPI